jgi:hypothetical protein
MKTITEQIVERLEQLANEWSSHTPQCEALFMAAKEALTFQDKEKEQMIDFAFKYGDLTTREIADSFDKEYKTNEK